MMKKLLASALAAGALLLPASTVSADEGPPVAGVKGCPPGYIGYVVWIDTKYTDYQEPVWFCIPFGP